MMRNWGSMGAMGSRMLRAVYLSILLVSFAGATGPALAQSFPPPHPIPPVDIGEVNIPRYVTPPTYGAPAQQGRAFATGPESYPPAAVDRVPSSSGATPPVYSQPLPPPPQESTYGASPAGPESNPPAAVDRIPSSGATPPIYSPPTSLYRLCVCGLPATARYASPKSY